MKSHQFDYLLDFSYKVCNCCINLQLFGSTFNQKGRAYDWIIKPCFRFWRWGFVFWISCGEPKSVLSKALKYIGCFRRNERNKDRNDRIYKKDATFIDF